MNFIKRMLVLCYVSLGLFLSCLVLLFVAHQINFCRVIKILHVFYFDDNLRIVAGSLAGILLLKNFLFYRIFSVNTRRNKIVAFDNPAGRVSVSLSALEDLLKRRILGLTEIKEVKVNINASKKGLVARIRLVLASEMRIPELASKIQELVKRKIQNMIGIEESIDVIIYVGKILSEKIKEGSSGKKDSSDEGEKLEPNIPFQGYRA